MRLIAVIFACILKSSAATTAIEAGFKDLAIITTCKFGETPSVFCPWAKSTAISNPVSFSRNSRSDAIASACDSSKEIRTVKIRRPRIISCSISKTKTENSESKDINFSVIPGLSSPERRISPVNARLFLFGIGSD